MTLLYNNYLIIGNLDTSKQFKTTFRNPTQLSQLSNLLRDIVYTAVLPFACGLPMSFEDHPSTCGDWGKSLLYNIDTLVYCIKYFLFLRFCFLTLLVNMIL